MQTDRYRAPFSTSKYYLPRPPRGVAGNEDVCTGIMLSSYGTDWFNNQITWPRSRLSPIRSTLLPVVATNRQQLEFDSWSRSTLSPTQSTLLPIRSTLSPVCTGLNANALCLNTFCALQPTTAPLLVGS